MLWINLKPVILVLGALTLLGAGTGAVIYGVAATDGPPSDRPLAASGGPGAKPSGARPPAAEPPAGKKKSKNTVVVCRHEGMIDVVGTEIKPGEKAEPDRMVQVRVGTERRNFKTLQEGDRVKAGQLLLRLDDRLARNKLKIALAKLALAKTDLEGATKVFEEAVVRYQGAKKLFDRNPPLISREEYGEKKLARDRFQTEVEGKKAQILVAEAEAANAEIILDMHEVRSPVNGFVAVIYRRPGEGVKALDPVIEIMPEQKEP